MTLSRIDVVGLLAVVALIHNGFCLDIHILVRSGFSVGGLTAAVKKSIQWIDMCQFSDTYLMWIPWNPCRVWIPRRLLAYPHNFPTEHMCSVMGNRGSLEIVLPSGLLQSGPLIGRRKPDYLFSWKAYPEFCLDNWIFNCLWDWLLPLLYCDECSFSQNSIYTNKLKRICQIFKFCSPFDEKFYLEFLYLLCTCRERLIH